jgi:hypothetical protein
MKKPIALLVGGLLCGSVAVGAEQSEPPAQQTPAEAPPAEGAPPEAAQPPMTKKDIDAAAMEAAKKEFEAGQQQATGGGTVDYKPWSPPAQAPKPKTAPPHAGSQYHAASVPGSASQTYAAQWGIDTLRVEYTSSGNLLRFTYRVVDPKLAAPLADKKFTPSLYCPKHRAVLSVPVMEKIGPLRQAMGQEAGKDYWMAFSNRGQIVKPGDRVNVTIGSFHADGIRVE